MEAISIIQQEYHKHSWSSSKSEENKKLIMIVKKQQNQFAVLFSIYLTITTTRIQNKNVFDKNM